MARRDANQDHVHSPTQDKSKEEPAGTEELLRKAELNKAEIRSRLNERYLGYMSDELPGFDEYVEKLNDVSKNLVKSSLEYIPKGSPARRSPQSPW